MQLHYIHPICWRTCTCSNTGLRSDLKDFHVRCFDDFFVCFPDFRCRTALKNRLGLWSDFPSVLPPKIDENDSKIHAKTAQKAFQNGCKIWMPLGIAFLSILYEFGPPGGDHLGLFFAKNGATLIYPFASRALGVEFSLPGSVLAPNPPSHPPSHPPKIILQAPMGWWGAARRA